MSFKVLGRLAIPLAVAVPMNYLTCTVAGFWLSHSQALPLQIMESPWLFLSVLQGLFYYAGFSLLALASQRIGVAVAALFSRLAMAVPVMVSLVFLGDALNLAKSAGILVAFASVVFLSRRNGQPLQCRQDKYLLLALSLFGSHGVQLSLMNIAQHYYLADDRAYHSYMAASFFFALVVSCAAFCLQMIIKRLHLRLGHIAAGVIVGLFNYTTVYFLLKALSTPGWGGSVVFPLFSIGVVGGSALGARLFFKERLTRPQLSGLGLGILAVALLSLA
ncbi:MAG: hypothetical protein PVG03_12340 [Desulfarculaceae bacterium]